VYSNFLSIHSHAFVFPIQSFHEKRKEANERRKRERGDERGDSKFSRSSDGSRRPSNFEGGDSSSAKKGYTPRPFNAQRNYRKDVGDESSDEEEGKTKGGKDDRKNKKLRKKPEEIALPALKQRTAEQLTEPATKQVGANAEVMAKTGFAALGLDSRICDHLESLGYTAPTRIQEAAIPVLARRKDTLVKSETGSGKTLAYLLPVIQDLIDRPDRITRDAGTFALVLAPTRELAVQIENVFKQVAKPFYWLVATTLMGGENKKAEKARLRKGTQVVIGTPGRIKDHMETTQAWQLGKIRWFILDEADRLLDLGFEESMKAIYKFVDVVANAERDVRCNVLVSATLNKGDGVDSLAETILRDPQFVGFDDKEEAKKAKEEKKKDAAKGDDSASESESEVESSDSEDERIKASIIAQAKGRAAPAPVPAPSTSLVSGEDQFVTPTTLKQLYVEMSSRHRLVALASFLRLRIVSAQKSNTKCKLIVFVSTCAAVEFLHKVFSHTYWPDYQTGHAMMAKEDGVAAPEPELDMPKDPLLDTQLWKLHGNMPQKLRTTTYFDFYKASEGILFCTDVAARGLDLPAVDWIVQYDAPEDTDDYVHRVGRTARIGHAGQALLFLVQSEIGYIDILKSKGIMLESVSLERMLAGLHVGLQKISLQPIMGPNGRPLPAGAILQKQLEYMCQISPDLANLAREAYISFFRSYAAYPKELKRIFHPKRLHFGEVAHSFALIGTFVICMFICRFLVVSELTHDPTLPQRNPPILERRRLLSTRRHLKLSTPCRLPRMRLRSVKTNLNPSTSWRANLASAATSQSSCNKCIPLSSGMFVLNYILIRC
jgi:ATP-dependent RNA helicase DDX31/DBP7